MSPWRTLGSLLGLLTTCCGARFSYGAWGRYYCRGCGQLAKWVRPGGYQSGPPLIFHLTITKKADR